MKRTAQNVYPSGNGRGPGVVYYLWSIGDGFSGPSGTPYDDGASMNSPYWQYSVDLVPRNDPVRYYMARNDYEDREKP